MEKIIVNLPYLQETLVVGKGILKAIEQEIKAGVYDQFLVIADKNAFRHHQGYFQEILNALRVPDTNVVYLAPRPKDKDMWRAQSIIKKLSDIGASRKTCILAIGGGYIGDLAGFVAAIYMRGITCIQIPTTLMSQADAIMGKVAVNFGNKKNLVGAFYSPKFVFCETEFLSSLESREELYGLVEIWKHALLVNDDERIAAINRYLSGQENLDYADLVTFSLNVKKLFVEADPFDETGEHKALSLGHTLANVLEKNPSFRHGLAVFYGIVFETLLAKEASRLSSRKYDSMLHTAALFEQKFEQLVNTKKTLQRSSLLEELSCDKINSHGTYTFVIPTDDGHFLYKDIPGNFIDKVKADFLSVSLLQTQSGVSSREVKLPVN